MKLLLRLLAIVVLLSGTGIWLATGAHRGWTQTSVPVKFVDEVTGIEGIRYEPKFLPGYDFLVGICVVSLLLRGAAFLVSGKRPPATIQRGSSPEAVRS